MSDYVSVFVIGMCFVGAIACWGLGAYLERREEEKLRRFRLNLLKYERELLGIK